MAHYSQSCTGIYNQKTAASTFRRHTLNFLEVANSCLIHYHASKAGRNLSFFTTSYLSWYWKPRPNSKGGCTYTNPRQNTLLCPTTTKLLRPPPVFVKMFPVSFQSILGTRPLCLSSLGDGDSQRKKRTSNRNNHTEKLQWKHELQRLKRHYNLLDLSKSPGYLQVQSNIRYSEERWFSCGN